MWPKVWKLGRAAGIAYLLAVGLAMAMEPRLIYFPRRARSDGAGTTAGVRVTNLTLSLPDGGRVTGWEAVPEMGAARTILLFHGNGGDVEDKRELMLGLAHAPARVVMLDYPGYGWSPGSPSEAGMVATATAAWEYVTGREHLPASQVVIFGESLGNAAAIDLAARTRPAGLVVQSAFTSMRDMAARQLPWVPGFCVRTRMDNLDKIGRVTCPMLFVHSDTDATVPYWMGRRLFDAARGPKAFLTLHGVRHADAENEGRAAYWDAVRGFVRTPSGSPSGSPFGKGER